MYSDGDLCIRKDKLDGLFEEMEPGQYTTFEIIEKYQGFMAVNQGKNVKESWNASFARIIKQYSVDYPEIIFQVASEKPIFLDDIPTTTSVWEIFGNKF